MSVFSYLLCTTCRTDATLISVKASNVDDGAVIRHIITAGWCGCDCDRTIGWTAQRNVQTWSRSSRSRWCFCADCRLVQIWSSDSEAGLKTHSDLLPLQFKRRRRKRRRRKLANTVMRRKSLTCIPFVRVVFKTHKLFTIEQSRSCRNTDLLFLPPVNHSLHSWY